MQSIKRKAIVSINGKDVPQETSEEEIERSRKLAS